MVGLASFKTTKQDFSLASFKTSKQNFRGGEWSAWPLFRPPSRTSEWVRGRLGLFLYNTSEPPTCVGLGYSSAWPANETFSWRCCGRGYLFRQICQRSYPHIPRPTAR